MGSHCIISPQSVSTVCSLITWWEWGDVVQSHPWLCFHPGTLHYPTSIQVWNSCGILSGHRQLWLHVFLISSSLTSGVSPTDQSWKPTGLPGHHQRGGSGRDLRHYRALCPVQVRYPHPENRQQLQGLHVRCFTPPASLHLTHFMADTITVVKLPIKLIFWASGHFHIRNSSEVVGCSGQNAG